ncbi:hypothetical protein SAMN05216232_2533 [Virgibacillus subterraneus]|uniref:Uncharacterized protein n=1 Tax=Virgibacillus subterraneus TaxID=621109 RepID=A0A1H9GAN0_9BACI|nr:hypothetical protein [Virgibacillus subterraneus]SEQ47157.1 hypothetical protein SAMN05216232_2533 [Virgibacillus subterraneus]
MTFEKPLITYQSHVKPYGEHFRLVVIDDKTLYEIDQFAKSIVKVKKNESHHKYDNNSHYKRYFTGTLGEVALEKYLNVSGIVNWSIGDSKKYHEPDLKNIGVNAGIKTVDYGLFPIIFKKSYSNEIIMIRWKKRYVYICGLASKEVLYKYQSDDLIKDPKLKARGTKTGFYGFEQLQGFTNLDELRRIGT